MANMNVWQNHVKVNNVFLWKIKWTYATATTLRPLHPSASSDLICESWLYYLAHQIAESEHVGLYVMLLFHICLFLTIPVGPIISKSTTPVFRKFSGLVDYRLLGT